MTPGKDRFSLSLIRRIFLREIGRPSLLYATAVGDDERIDSVEVGGAAVIVAEGVFRITSA